MLEPLIVANWKMHKTHLEALAWLQAFRKTCSKAFKTTPSLVLAPPFTALETLARALAEEPLAFPLHLAAQNIASEPSGAFTGEVSAPMLEALGVQYVIIGHSERRQLFHESNASISQKLKAALSHQLKPILCIGENATANAQGKTLDYLKTQLEGCLEEVETFVEEDFSRLTIAYEPIWAIGTGITPSPEAIEAIHSGLRDYLIERFGQSGAHIPLLYGGSLKASNCHPILSQKSVNGALVGGASLDAEEFARIIEACG